MAIFSHVATFVGGVFAHDSLISDMEIVPVNGSYRLYTASMADGGLTAFDLASGQAAVQNDTAAYSLLTGTYSVRDIDVVTLNGQQVLLSAGRYDDALAFRQIAADGSFGGLIQPSVTGAAPANPAQIEMITTSESSFLYVNQPDQSGLTVYEVLPDFSMVEVQSIPDTPAVGLGHVSEMLQVRVGSETFLVVASETEDSVTSFRVAPDGSLTMTGLVDPSRGLGVDGLHSLSPVTVGSTTYIVAGAYGTDNIVVVEVRAGGGLEVRETILDTLDTRFQNVTALETFEAGGRAYVLAGGSDDGITLFELGPNGSLHLLSVVSDSYATTLADVSAITAQVVGGEVQVFVASSTEDGLTQFTLSLGDLGTLTTIGGSNTGGALNGSGADDFLVGDDGRNTLQGGDGNDRLVDGGDLDTLYGGAGADVFVMVRDYGTDWIADFESGLDRIDLSGIPFLYDVSQLSFEDWPGGIRIRFGAEVLRIETMDGQDLSAGDFSNGDFIFY